MYPEGYFTQTLPDWVFPLTFLFRSSKTETTSPPSAPTAERRHDVRPPSESDFVRLNHAQIHRRIFNFPRGSPRGLRLPVQTPPRLRDERDGQSASNSGYGPLIRRPSFTQSADYDTASVRKRFAGFQRKNRRRRNTLVKRRFPADRQVEKDSVGTLDPLFEVPPPHSPVD